MKVSQIIYEGGTGFPPPGGAAFYDSSLSLPLSQRTAVAVKQHYCPQRSEAQIAPSHHTKLLLKVTFEGGKRKMKIARYTLKNLSHCCIQ